MTSCMSKGISEGEFLRMIVSDDVDIYRKIIAWTEEDYKELSLLLEKLDEVNKNKDSKTTEKGEALEKVARYVIDKTFFFKVHNNIETTTNEIDQVVQFTKDGRQALHRFGISRKVIPIPEDIFLGECKNYSSKLGVTWIGKFYGLLTTCRCNFGIIFTTNGVTGHENGWADSYGLMKAYNLIESYRSDEEFSIIEININDIKKMLNERRNILDIIESKILALRIGCSFENLLDGIEHENTEEIKQYFIGSTV